MAVINVTPDSFSGDGVTTVDGALALARRFAGAGADILDVGGESTRPDAEGVAEEDELSRVLPVIERLAREVELPISVDTYRSEVARQALDAGAHMLNDTWGFRQDEGMAPLCAERGVPAVIMHNQRGRQFRDVAGDIICGLGESIRLAEEAGLSRERLIVDPGFGFGWTPEQNIEIMARLGELKVLGRPILVGTSRKSTLGMVTGKPVEERLAATAASVALAIGGGADIVRVHDVEFMVDVCKVADAIVRDRPANPVGTQLAAPGGPGGVDISAVSERA